MHTQGCVLECVTTAGSMDCMLSSLMCPCLICSLMSLSVIFCLILFFTEWASTALITLIIRFVYEYDVMKVGSKFLLHTQSRWIAIIMSINILMASYVALNNKVIPVL